MGERRLRWIIMAEIFGLALIGAFLLIDVFEEPTRIGVPVGILLPLLLIVIMIVVGIVGLMRPRNRK